MGGSSWNVPGAAPSLFIVGGAPLLHPETQVFEGMLAGWRDQQLARNLSKGTIEDRLSAVQRFQRFTNEWPWTWRPADVEEYTAHLRSDGRERSHSTIRGYHGHVRLFLEYAADPRYEWTAVSERLFGTHPSQVFFEWNTAVHVAEYEGRPGRRALTKVELQQFFDYADDQAAAARTSGRKGWLPAMRDATAMKATYAWGLRRREVIKLDLADFGRNPHAPEFGDLGVVYVRWGKASKGSAPKRRSVLTVFPWSVKVLEQWVGSYRTLFETAASSGALWPSERSPRLDMGALGDRFASYRDALGLPQELTLHCLRHSYVTHLIEAGYDPLFVQQQVGHSYASTTALYTSVSSDFRTRTLRKVLDGTISRAIGAATGEGLG
ncbi:tyrosine-type recombinase/integrase [Streptomyces sp. NPDC056224]|uniref:tyrosine-type recombinase/integrase n=1 Tax=Streptomyces sp. NPDC056224 TaxID=3345750 RepID=UPI0035DC4C45